MSTRPTIDPTPGPEPGPEHEHGKLANPGPDAAALAELLLALHDLFPTGDYGAGLPPEDPELARERFERLLDGLRAGYPTSPVASDSDLDDGVLPFTAFGQFGYGAMDLRVLDQQQYWVDVHGRSHLLTQMSSDYLGNVIAHLHDNANSLHLAVVRRWAAQALTEATDSRRPDGQHARKGQPPYQLSSTDWLETTPLVLALRERIKEAASDDTGAV